MLFCPAQCSEECSDTDARLLRPAVLEVVPPPASQAGNWRCLLTVFHQSFTQPPVLRAQSPVLQIALRAGEVFKLPHVLQHPPCWHLRPPGRQRERRMSQDGVQQLGRHAPQLRCASTSAAHAGRSSKAGAVVRRQQQRASRLLEGGRKGGMQVWVPGAARRQPQPPARRERAGEQGQQASLSGLEKEGVRCHHFTETLGRLHLRHSCPPCWRACCRHLQLCRILCCCALPNTAWCELRAAAASSTGRCVPCPLSRLRTPRPPAPLTHVTRPDLAAQPPAGPCCPLAGPQRSLAFRRMRRQRSHHITSRRRRQPNLAQSSGPLRRRSSLQA